MSSVYEICPKCGNNLVGTHGTWQMPCPPKKMRQTTPSPHVEEGKNSVSGASDSSQIVVPKDNSLDADRATTLQAELDSVTDIFNWFIKKLDAINLDGTTPQDVMIAFKEIAQTCKRAQGMIRLSKPARNPMLCKDCNGGNHSGHNDANECVNDNSFNSDCECAVSSYTRASDASKAVHWTLKSGVNEAVCGTEVSPGVLTSVIGDMGVTCPLCQAAFVGYKFGRADASGYVRGLEDAKALAQSWANSPTCSEPHEDDPCCHRRTGAGIADAIERLISQHSPEVKVK